MHSSLSYYLAQTDLRHYARSDTRICAVPARPRPFSSP